MESEVRITTKEAARLAGVNPKTIRRWIASGRLPAEMVGKVYYVNPDDVIEAKDNPEQRPVAVEQAQQPQGVDITPLLNRMEELTRENHELRSRLQALAAPPIPMWKRLMFWKEHTHEDASPPALPPERDRGA